MGLVQGHSLLEVLGPVGFLCTPARVPTGRRSVCLGFKGRGRPLGKLPQWHQPPHLHSRGSIPDAQGCRADTRGPPPRKRQRAARLPLLRYSHMHGTRHGYLLHAGILVYVCFTCKRILHAHPLHHEYVASCPGLCTRPFPTRVCAHAWPGSACREELAARFPLPLSFSSVS